MAAQAWRQISPEESGVVRAIVSACALPDTHGLVEDLHGALVSNATMWILDVKPTNSSPASALPDGPFPARAFAPSNAAYQGEIIIWITDGHLSGLEYAWVTDGPPGNWPRPNQIEVVPQRSS